MADFLAGRDGAVTEVLDDGENLHAVEQKPSYGIRDQYLPVADDWAEREQRGRSTSADTPRCNVRGCPVVWPDGEDRPCDEHADVDDGHPAESASFRRRKQHVDYVLGPFPELLDDDDRSSIWPKPYITPRAPFVPPPTSPGNRVVHARLASAAGQVRPVCVVRRVAPTMAALPYSSRSEHWSQRDDSRARSRQVARDRAARLRGSVSAPARLATGTGAVDSAVALSASPRRRTYSTPAGRAAQRAAALIRWSDPQARARQSQAVSAAVRGKPRPGQRHEDARAAARELLLANPGLAVVDVARKVGASQDLVRPVRDELVAAHAIHRWTRKTRGAPFHAPSCWCRADATVRAVDVSVTAGLAGAAGRSA